MNKQELARARNSLKFRLSGAKAIFNVNNCVTQQELSTLLIINANIEALLEVWDSRSIQLGLKVKPYKCEYCGKHSNKNYPLENMTACKKCHNNLKDLVDGK